MSKKKQYITAAVLILAGLVILGGVIWKQIGPASNGINSQSQNEAAEVPESPSLSKPSSNPEISVSEKTLETLLYGHTYEYVDDYRSGYPVTYTFYKDGRLLVYYWAKEESEDIPIGSAEAYYTVNDALNEITLTWTDDNSSEVKKFSLSKGKLKLGDSVLEEVNKEFYINGKEITHE